MTHSFLKIVFTVTSLLMLIPHASLALTKAQLGKCVSAEAKELRSKSIINMSELETKVLADPKSLRSFIEDSGSAKSPHENTIARTLMKESKTCDELAEKWADKPETARTTAEQIAEIFTERGATVRAEDVESKILKPALQKFNEKLARDFSLAKHPGLATLAAIYFTPEGTIELPTSSKIPAREKKVGEQLRKAQSSDEAEQIIVIDTRNSLADALESQWKKAQKAL